MNRKVCGTAGFVRLILLNKQQNPGTFPLVCLGQAFSLVCLEARVSLCRIAQSHFSEGLAFHFVLVSSNPELPIPKTAPRASKGRGEAGGFFTQKCTTRDWFKCTRPKHPAHGGVMLCTVQCRPASACARKSPPRGCTLKKQDKTRRICDSGPFSFQFQSLLKVRHKKLTGASSRPTHTPNGTALESCILLWSRWEDCLD